MIRCALLILAAGLLVAADDPTKTDQAKLQGDWKIVSVEREGKPDRDLEKFRFTFAGDKLTVKRDEDSRMGTFKLDAARKPGQITILLEDSKKNLEGIYAFDGDNLKLCLGDLGEERPTAFATKVGSKVMLFVLKRDKP